MINKIHIKFEGSKMGSRQYMYTKGNTFKGK